MITIHNDAAKKRLADCFAHAITLGILDNLLGKLEYLSHYGEQEDYQGNQPHTECLLGWDFADYSLSVLVTYHYRQDATAAPRDSVWLTGTMAGGLIFHPGATGPDGSLSIQLNPSDAPSWSVHT